MSQWTGYWKIVQPQSRKQSYGQPTVEIDDNQNLNTAGYAAFASNTWFSNLLKGSTSRMQRYKQYDAMDQGDINRALDIIAEELSAPDKRTGLPFIIEYLTEENQEIPDSITVTLRAALRHWSSLHSLDRQMFNISRTMCKYGDCIFKKTSDTKKWEYVDATRVMGIEVNDVGHPVNYHIRPSSFQNSVANAAGKQPGTADAVEVVPAVAVIHFTLSDNMSETAPFGMSLLQSAFRDYQKLTMLEDASIMYRLVRAPSRRVFYVDTGNIPPQRVKQHLETIRNDIRQKRMPNTANGDQTDSTYNAECLALDTRIPLLDGRVLSLQDIITERNNGLQHWAYSCDPITGAFAPGLVTWAGVTRRNTEVIKLTLDNGKEIICTPDHKFDIRGRGRIEAQDIRINEDSLFPHNTRKTVLYGRKDYEQLWDNSKHEWVWTHRAVSAFKDQHQIENVMRHRFEGDDNLCNTVHHCDFDRFNNNPHNLVKMQNRDHILYHSANMEPMRDGFRRWKEADTLTGYASSYTNWRNKNIERCKNWSLNPAIIESRIRSGQESPNILKNQKKTFNQSVHDRLVELAKQNNWKKRETLYAASLDEMFIRSVKESNVKIDSLLFKIKYETVNTKFFNQFCECFDYTGWKNFASLNNPDYLPKQYFKNVKIDEDIINSLLSLSQNLDKVSDLQTIIFERFENIKSQTAAYALIKTAYAALGVDSWSEFKQKSANFNHKVVKIEKVSNRDTGTLTIDGREIYHGHHNFALEAGVITRNSIQEDFFFAVNSAGRGSRVEQLESSTTWDMPELDYFQNKVFRSLRVPSSYMKGQDSAVQGAQWTDGKVGVAYMEERIFAQFIQRLQACVDSVLDEQFKIYLQVTGINIDLTSFKLTLPEPQNFALYRQAGLDTDLINSFNAIKETPYLSPRFMLGRYLGLTKDEIEMNAVMVKEERGIKEGGLPELQQLYDPIVLSNREAPTVDAIPPVNEPGEQLPPEEPEGEGEEPSTADDLADLPPEQ